MDWKKGSMPIIVVEDSGYPGVKKIAGKVAEDIHRVIGERPEVLNGKARTTTMRGRAGL